MTVYILIAVLAIALGIFVYWLLVKVPALKPILYVVLPIAIVALTYYIYKGIDEPIQFEKEKAKRYEVVKQNLIDIRTAQEAYIKIYGVYADHLDSLIASVKNDSLPNVRAIGSVPDSLLEKGYTEKRAAQEGIIIRDTILEPILASAFPKNFPIDSLKYVPFSGGMEFELERGVIETASKVKVQVFEARAPFDWWLKGLNEQLIINLNEQRRLNDQYEGLKVGSLTETNNNAGNWE